MGGGGGGGANLGNMKNLHVATVKQNVYVIRFFSYLKVMLKKGQMLQYLYKCELDKERRLLEKLYKPQTKVFWTHP